jgi:hypothetical protein
MFTTSGVLLRWIHNALLFVLHAAFAPVQPSPQVGKISSESRCGGWQFGSCKVARASWGGCERRLAKRVSGILRATVYP